MFVFIVNVLWLALLVSWLGWAGGIAVFILSWLIFLKS